MLLTVKYSKVFYLKFSFLFFIYILVKINCFPVDKDPIKDIFLKLHLFFKSLGDEHSKTKSAQSRIFLWSLLNKFYCLGKNEKLFP